MGVRDVHGSECNAVLYAMGLFVIIRNETS